MENIGKTIFDISCSDVFLGSVSQSNKSKSKWNLIKLTSFCTAKETINKMKKPTEWEKILQMISPIRINLQNIQMAHTDKYERNRQPNQEMGRRSKQTFLQKDIQMSKMHIKTCCTTLIIVEIQIKTIMRYHITLVRMVITKKSTNNKCWRRCGEKGILLLCWLECKLVQPL